MPRTATRPQTASRTNKKKGAKREKRSRQYIPLLRKALVDEKNKDKDVTKDVAAFMKYDRAGLDLTIEFCTALTPAALGKWALELTKANMQKKYDDSKYAWYDEDKREELIEHEGAARFLVVRENNFYRKPLAFVHFRFTLQGEAVGVVGGEPALYVMDIQLEESVRRKGLGRHLMRTLEMVARKQGMMHLMMPVVVKDEETKAFCLQGLKGFAVDDFTNVWDDDGGNPKDLLEQDGTFLVLSKTLEAAKLPVSDDAVSAAATPEKEGSASVDAGVDGVSQAIKFVEKQQEKEAFAEGLSQLQAKTSALRVSGGAASMFDPTFGASQKEEEEEDATAKRLLEQLEAFDVIPAGLDGQAKTMLTELMGLFKLKNGRDPTEKEVEKWLKTIQEAAFEQEEEDDEDDSEEDEEEDEGEESDEAVIVEAEEEEEEADK